MEQNKNDGWPEHFNITPLDRVIDAGLAVARLVRHLRWEPRMSSSDHYEQPEAPETTRMAQLPLNYDGNGSEVE